MTRAESKARTRAALLDSAMEVFSERGFHGASVEEIAERAGFTRGAFYANFADKSDILMTLLEDVYRDSFAAVGDLVRDAADDDKLPAAQQWYEEATSSHPLDRAVTEFMPQARQDPDMRRRFAGRQAAARDAIAGMIEAYCRSAGITSPIPANEFAAISYAIGEGLALQRDFDPDAVPADLFAKAQLWLWAGVLGSAGG